MASAESARFIEKLNFLDINANTISAEDMEWRLKNPDLFNIIKFFNDSLSSDNYSTTAAEEEQYGLLSDEEKAVTSEQIAKMKQGIEASYPGYFDLDVDTLDIEQEEVAAKQELLDEYSTLVETLTKNAEDAVDEVSRSEIDLRNLSVDLETICELNVELNNKLINLELSIVALQVGEEHKRLKYNQPLLNKFSMDLKEVFFNSESDLMREIGNFNVVNEEDDLAILTQRSDLHLDKIEKSLQANLRVKVDSYANSVRYKTICSKLHGSNLVPTENNVYKQMLDELKNESENALQKIYQKEEMLHELIDSWIENKMNKVKYDLAVNKLQRRMITHRNIIMLQKRIVSLHNLCYFFQCYYETLNGSVQKLLKLLFEVNKLQTVPAMSNVPILANLIEKFNDFVPSKKDNDVVKFFKRFINLVNVDLNDKNITWFFKYLINNQIQNNSIIMKSRDVDNIYQISQPIIDIIENINRFFSDSPTDQILCSNIPFEMLLCDFESRFEKNREFLNSSLAKYNDCKNQLKDNHLFKIVFFFWIQFVLDPSKTSSTINEINDM